MGDSLEIVHDHPNTGLLERAILYYFADLWKLPRDKAWGYLANGSSEAIMFAAYSARKYFKEVKNYNKKPPIALFQLNNHYCVN